MILADTSVWIDYFRKGDKAFADRLQNGLIVMHPFVLGELACGSIKNRGQLLDDLQKMPAIPAAQDDEVLFMIERHELYGRCLGYIDMHLLAACLLSGASLWTRDKRLKDVVQELSPGT